MMMLLNELVKRTGKKIQFMDIDPPRGREAEMWFYANYLLKDNSLDLYLYPYALQRYKEFGSWISLSRVVRVFYDAASLTKR